MPTIRMHLNGGPYDDRYLDHWTSTLEVRKQPRWLPGGLVEDLATPSSLERTGHYVVRLDGNDQLVPHNLEGFVEADWQGWEA